MSGDTTLENPLTHENVIPKFHLFMYILSTKKMQFQTTSDDQANTMKTFAKEEGSIIK